MFQVLNCLAVEHDWRRVLLAVGVCLLASGVAVSLFHRAQATKGKARLRWLVLDAAAGGCGIWATHFIAMLAYDLGATAGYDLALTVTSLIVAAVLTGAGNRGRFARLFAMDASHRRCHRGNRHHGDAFRWHARTSNTGAYHLVRRSGFYRARALGCTFGGLALTVAAKATTSHIPCLRPSFSPSAIVSLHFTAMAAITFVPDPTVVASTISVSPTSLSLIISASAIIILGMSWWRVSPRQWQSKLRQQKFCSIRLCRTCHRACACSTPRAASRFSTNDIPK